MFKRKQVPLECQKKEGGGGGSQVPAPNGLWAERRATGFFLKRKHRLVITKPSFLRAAALWIVLYTPLSGSPIYAPARPGAAVGRKKHYTKAISFQTAVPCRCGNGSPNGVGPVRPSLISVNQVRWPRHQGPGPGVGPLIRACRGVSADGLHPLPLPKRGLRPSPTGAGGLLPRSLVKKPHWMHTVQRNLACINRAPLQTPLRQLQEALQQLPHRVLLRATPSRTCSTRPRFRGRLRRLRQWFGWNRLLGGGGGGGGSPPPRSPGVVLLWSLAPLLACKASQRVFWKRLLKLLFNAKLRPRLPKANAPKV
jgi:hypothetical protein